VTPRRPRGRRRNQAKRHEAVTNPQGRARPAAGNQREIAATGEVARPRDAEIPLANVRSAPEPAITRPPSTRRAVRKGRLNFLHFPEDSRMAPAYRARSRVRFTQVKRPPCDKGCIVKIGVPHGPNDRQCWRTRST
jgi:hypothetical protein